MSTSNIEDYDILVLGSGEAGKYIGWTMARKGKRVAVIERKYIGGSCPNIACLPSKNIIRSAKVASFFFRSEEFGITKSNVRINMAGVRERKRAMVRGLVETHEANFKSSGAELILGSGGFVGPKTIEVTLNDGGARTLRGQNVVISTGSRARVDSVPGLLEAKPMTHVEALELDLIPQRLLVIGGGYIGLELAQAMRRFGSEVTIIERNSRILHLEDPDITEALAGILRHEGINIVTSAVMQRVEGKSGKSVKIFAMRDEREITLEGTHILAAAGRLPNTSGIGLDAAGVEITGRGFVKVNERLETSAPGVWAVGDCAGSPHFTHIAYDDFRVVRDNIFGGNRVTTGRLVPSCTFTDPEFARVGLSETEAAARGIAYSLAKIPMTSVLRTRTLSETQGFMKALIDPATERILGFAALGEGVGELLATIQLAMTNNLPYTALRDCIITHPTISEGLMVLFSNVASSAAH
jgi:pyruvate/2-oxoglutarate dehydrogenase complex dihydrolipoamide dehydrogenase (E3) component